MWALLQHQHAFRMQHVALDEALIDHTRHDRLDVLELQRVVAPRYASRRKQDVETHRRRSRCRGRRPLREEHTFARQIAPEADLQLLAKDEVEPPHPEPVHVPVQFIQCRCCLATFEVVGQPGVDGRQVGGVQKGRRGISTQDEVCRYEWYQDGSFVS